MTLVLVEHCECDLGASMTLRPNIPADTYKEFAFIALHRRSQTDVVDEIQFRQLTQVIVA